MVLANKKIHPTDATEFSAQRTFRVGIFPAKAGAETRALSTRVAIFPLFFPKNFLWKNDNSKVVSICKN